MKKAAPQGRISALRGLVWAGARRALRQVVTGLSVALSVGLVGALGGGFLIAAAYLALRAPLGAPLAALVMGAGLLALAGAILCLSRMRSSGSHPKATPEPAPKPAADPNTDPAHPDAGSIGSMLAFTTAFLLARYLSDPDRK